MRSRRWQGQTNSDSTLVFPSLWSHLMAVFHTVRHCHLLCLLCICLFVQDLILSWLFLWRLSKVAVFWGKGVRVLSCLVLVPESDSGLWTCCASVPSQSCLLSHSEYLFSETVYPFYITYAYISHVSLIVVRITSILKWSCMCYFSTEISI